MAIVPSQWTVMQGLKRFLEWYLGIPPAEPGQGTAWDLVYQSPRPPWLPVWGALLLAVAAVAYVVAVYFRDAQRTPVWVRWTLTGLRLAAVGLMLLVLMQVTLSVDRTGLPTVAVLIDDSASMGLQDQYADSAESPVPAEPGSLEDREETPTRLELVKRFLTRDDGEVLRRLQRNHKLRVYRFSETAVPVGRGEYAGPEDLQRLLPLLRNLEATGDQTRPGPAVQEVLSDLRGTPPTALVVFSDGITSTTEADRLTRGAEAARNRLVPIFTVGVGSSEAARDLQLYDLLVDEVAFVEEPLLFSAKLKAFGLGGERVQLTLKDRETGDVLARQRVQAPDDGDPRKVQLAYTPPEEGEFDYVLQAVPVPQETNKANNAEARHVSVRREQIRVLLADSLPRYEFRYLKHLLERERTVELNTVLQEADPAYADEDETALRHFPVRREELFGYDVVIFGDINPGYLSTRVLENLHDFVRDAGGGMISVAGPRFNPSGYRGTPLEVLLPIRLNGVKAPSADEPIRDGFRPTLTTEGGRGSPLFRFGDSASQSLQIWNNLPELYWLLEAPELKSGAIVLAEHPSRRGRDRPLPVIAMQRYGAGKVLFHATDELWRWRFRIGDRYYGRYWIQALRNLTRSKLLGRDRAAELTTDRLVYQQGDTVQLRVRFLDDRVAPSTGGEVTVVVEHPGGSQRRIGLSRVPGTSAVYEGELRGAQDGSYHAFVASPSFEGTPPSADFRVRAPLQELERRRLDRAELVRTAQKTHGQYYPLADASGLPGEMPRGQSVPLESQDPIPLWNRWELLLLFTTILSAEWLLRKRCRLV